jgi:hypothetical protein
MSWDTLLCLSTERSLSIPQIRGYQGWRSCEEERTRKRDQEGDKLTKGVHQSVSMPTDDLLALRIISAISCASSSLVLFLYLSSFDLQKTTFHKIIFYVCFCDFCSSVGFMIGFPLENSLACWFQALLINIFPVASVFWVTVISYMLYMNVFRRDHTTELLSWKVHLICWLLPIVVTLFPLITNKYGPLNERSGMCFIAERSNSPSWTLAFWTVVSFYFWIWSAITIYFILFVLLSLKVNEIYQLYQEESHSASGGIDLRAQVKATLNKFIWYPINIILCWTLPTVYDIMSTDQTSYHGERTFDIITDIIPAFLGMMNVIAFFLTNSLAREKLLKLFLTCFPCCSTIINSTPPPTNSSYGSRRGTSSASSESPLHPSPTAHATNRTISNTQTEKGLQMFQSYARDSEVDF